MYVEKISSRKEKHVEFEHAMRAATNGDLFVVFKLDRLARSTKALSGYRQHFGYCVR